MSKAKSIFFGVISSQVFMLASILLTIFSTPYILKKLDSEIYGLSIIIFQITGYLGIFDFGLTAGITRHLSGTIAIDEESRVKIQKIISTSFVGYIILGILVAIIGNLFAPYASAIFKIPVKYYSQTRSIISIICIIVGMQFILRCISGVFFAHQKQFISNTLSFILNISNTIFVIIFVFFGFGLWSFVYAQVCVFLINSILSFRIFNKHYPYVKLKVGNFDISLLKSMFSYGGFLFLNGIAVQIVFNTDKIMVGSIISLSVVSVFALTLRLPELLTQFIWKIIDNAFPSMVEISKDGKKKFRIAHDKIMVLTLSIASMGFWIIILFTFPFIKLWVGARFFAGINILFLISYLYLIQHTIIHVTAVCLNGAGHAKGFSILSIFEAALNIALTLYLGKIYGIIGIVGATVIAGIVTSGWYVPYIGIKYMKSNVLSYLSLLCKPIFTFTLFGIMAYLCFNRYFTQIDSWFALITCVSLTALYFMLPLYLLNRNTYFEIKDKLLSSRFRAK